MPGTLDVYLPGIVAIAITSLYFVINTIAIVFRLLAIRLLGRSLRSYDYLCLFSWANMVALLVLVMLGVLHGGLGAPLYKLTIPIGEYMLKCFWIAGLIVQTATSATRLSMVLLQLEMFRPCKSFVICCKFTVVIILAYWIGGMLVEILQCSPVQKFWHFYMSGHCLVFLKPYQLNATINLVLDLVIFTLPMPLLWRLKLPRSKRIDLCAVFGCSIIIAGINVARVIHSWTWDFEHFTFEAVVATLLTEAELCAGIVVSCVPIYGPLWKYLKRRKKSVPTIASAPPRLEEMGKTTVDNPAVVHISMISSDDFVREGVEL